ncbi:MAG: Ig-like domain-containing protein [Gemmatimonadaceae bacterium]|nr:Ig-like domain-containing protein [Gemmatimonadaceae bacterium]
MLVTSDLVTLHVGETASIRLAAAADQAANRRWATDDPAIADVDMAGTITGKETGSTTVTVTAGDRTTDILVTVLPVSTKSAVKAAQK